MNSGIETPFVLTSPYAAKVKCIVCGRTGWGELDPLPKRALLWQKACLDGHGYGCDQCPRVFISGAALAAHRRSHAKSA